MKLLRFWPALLVAIPALATAQGASRELAPDVRSALNTISVNVAQIRDPAEKDRWQANSDAWNLQVAAAGALDKVALTKLTAALVRMKENVAKIRRDDGGEKERWQADIALWQLLADHGGVLAKGDLAAARSAFEQMKANVAKIARPSEKERWAANRDLWQVTLNRAGAAL